MNGTNLVLDTNIVIYYFRGSEFARDLILNNEITISIITEIELLSYPNNTPTDIVNIKKLLSTFTIIPITTFIKDKTIEFRRKYKLKTPDSIIVATANYLNYALVTADKQLKNVEIDMILFEVP